MHLFTGGNRKGGGAEGKRLQIFLYFEHFDFQVHSIGAELQGIRFHLGLIGWENEEKEIEM